MTKQPVYDLQLYKFLVFNAANNKFQIYGDDDVLQTRAFPVDGTLVLFNEYGNFLNQQSKPTNEYLK